MSKEAARRRFIYNILDWSYRRAVMVFTVLSIISVIILMILGFLLEILILPFIVAIYGIIISIMWWSKRKTGEGIDWTLRNLIQQFRDWRFARRVRKEKERKEREKEKYGFSLP